jgi:ATP-dependent exoDNAse (exonuclease V) beta subunit
LNEKNGQGNSIAQYLTDHKYKVVSADSLLIDSDARIRLIISYLKIRNRTSNQREFMKFADLYLRLQSTQPELDYIALFDVDASGRRKFNAKRFISTHFKSESDFFISYTNLYDLIQKFYDLCHWSETHDIYLHHFADICFNFQLGRKVDLNSFLEYYESNRKKLAIQSPKTNDAIQIMTVHKSKGLQFPVVILPNVDYNTGAKGEYLIAGDNQVFYRKPKKESPIAAIRTFTTHELNQCFMDKLNLLYVAMTRPVHRLYVFNVYDKSNMGKSFHELLVSSYPSAKIDNLVHLQLGVEESVSLKVAHDVFYQPEEFGDRLWYPELVVRQGFENDHTLLGNAFHSIMATCNSMVDIDENIAQLLDNSALLPAQIAPLKAMVERILTDEKYLSWINNAEQTYNETWILSSDTSLLRPDKVFEMSNRIIVIDFKTGKEAPNHKRQLEAYKKILFAMKSKPVEGFIYYAQPGNWVPC